MIAKSVIEINSRITVNVNASAKTMIYVKKIIFEILLHEVVVHIENGKYLANIIDDSVITCDEIIDVEETKLFQ